MDGLTAKVFRTYNASITLDSELQKYDQAGIDRFDEAKILQFYNDANRKVAILCNHQKAVSKNHEEGMQKLKDKMDEIESQLKVAKRDLKKAKESKNRASMARASSKVEKLTASVHKHKLAVQTKEDNKTVALGTSKTNYMDPRITV